MPGMEALFPGTPPSSLLKVRGKHRDLGCELDPANLSLGQVCCLQCVASCSCQPEGGYVVSVCGPEWNSLQGARVSKQTHTPFNTAHRRGRQPLAGFCGTLPRAGDGYQACSGGEKVPTGAHAAGAQKRAS